MNNHHIVKIQTPRPTTVTGMLLMITLVLSASPLPAIAQAFADLKDALVEYSRADMEPGRACEELKGL